VRCSSDDPFNDFRRQFDNEAHVLQATRDLQHEHMIRWLAAYSRGTGEYSFMFPWAEGGTLREYWGYKDMTGSSGGSIRRQIVASLQQFRGMADALAQLHNRNIRHSDVKPENTLVFPAHDSVTGTWVVSDFGLSKQHNSVTSERGPTGTRRSSVQYEAPEAEDAIVRGGILTRLSDIWSLGCIITEHLIWLLYGHDELLRFGSGLSDTSSKGNNLSFFGRDPFSNAPFLKGSVPIWIGHMRNDSRCAPGTALRQLLDFVEDHLLVTTIRRSWGQLPPEQPQPLLELQILPGQPDVLDEQPKFLGPGVLPEVLGPGMRAAAWELRRKLDEILLTENSDGFFCAEGWGEHRKGPDVTSASRRQPSRSDFLSPDSAYQRSFQRAPQASAMHLRTNGTQNDVCGAPRWTLLMFS
jgi:serine/threonine protein kinase